MDINELQNAYHKPGKVEYLSIRPRREGPVTIMNKVQVLKDIGVEGDHYSNPGGVRQITLIQAEHLEVLASLLDTEKILPELTRRNIVVRGLNLLSLKGKKFRIGEAVLEYSGECHPCSRMEKNLGFGAYNAMRGHGGITAKVVQSGSIKIGDDVRVMHTNTKN